MEGSNSPEKPKSDLMTSQQAKDLLEKNKASGTDLPDIPYFKALHRISSGSEPLPLGATIRSFMDRKPIRTRVVGGLIKIIKENKPKKPNPNRKP